eukprot:6490952-Amphidinium_carterae.2
MANVAKSVIFNSRVLEAIGPGIGAIDKKTEDRISHHLTWEKKPCADPRKLDFPEFEPVCKDIRLSVRCIGQEVHIGKKDPRSRSLTPTELIQICEVMLALVDPACYPWGTKSQKKTTEKAQQMRSKWYPSFANAVNEEMTIKHTQALSSDDEGPVDFEGLRLLNCPRDTRWGTPIPVRGRVLPDGPSEEGDASDCLNRHSRTGESGGVLKSDKSHFDLENLFSGRTCVVSTLKRNLHICVDLMSPLLIDTCGSSPDQSRVA